KITIYRILQELMTNMKKHSKASHVVITFIQKPKRIFINYLDNSIGGKLKKALVNQ
ncbi:MAG: signal transduction histidine kinase, partial [Urechidicola sp.]